MSNLKRGYEIYMPNKVYSERVLELFMEANIANNEARDLLIEKSQAKTQAMVDENNGKNPKQWTAEKLREHYTNPEFPREFTLFWTFRFPSGKLERFEGFAESLATFINIIDENAHSCMKDADYVFVHKCELVGGMPCQIATDETKLRIDDGGTLGRIENDILSWVHNRQTIREMRITITYKQIGE